jgi:membrane fusion protein, copper/silver efflux system
MNMKRWISLGLVLLVAAGIFLWLSGRETPDSMKSTPPASTAAKGQEAMPGMDMSTPSKPEKPAAATEEAPTVEIPQDKQRLIGVKTVPAAVIAMKKTIRMTGRVESDEQRLFTVNTKSEGWIERLYVDYTGKILMKGEPLLEIYSPELLAAQQELISLNAWEKPAGKGSNSTENMLASDSARLVDAARRRLRLWDIPEAQIKKIEQTGKPIRSLTIMSPVSGYVVKRYVNRGMRVMPGEPLLDIADLSQVWVVSEVNETDIDQIKPGIIAHITFAGMPGKVFSSPVDFVYPSLSQDTRTLKVRNTLANPDGVLKPQMFAVVEIAVDLGSRLAIPDEAVMDTGERQIVYVDKGEGLFEPREVTAGIHSNDMREIIKGLKSGERVASSALFLIDSEAQLKGVAPASH